MSGRIGTIAAGRVRLARFADRKLAREACRLLLGGRTIVRPEDVVVVGGEHLGRGGGREAVGRPGEPVGEHLSAESHVKLRAVCQANPRQRRRPGVPGARA